MQLYSTYYPVSTTHVAVQGPSAVITLPEGPVAWLAKFHGSLRKRSGILFGYDDLLLELGLWISPTGEGILCELAVDTTVSAII